IPDSYWVQPGQLLAGEYPGALQDERARQKLCQLLRAGVSFFLDLTEEGEYGLKPYAPLLHKEAVALGCSTEHHRRPIRDMETPTQEEMAGILDTIDAALNAWATNIDKPKSTTGSVSVGLS
ncbi:MAG: hypothetical protein V3V75_02045, partial [Thermoguttaceae bacterium]